ncbi:hypothetical protein AUP68_12619 [Ilyonectria robusta]
MTPGDKTEASPAPPIGTVVDTNSSLSVYAAERNEKAAGIGSSVPATAVDAGSEKTIPVPTSNLNSGPDDDADSIESKDELALSKGRCIALVATVTGASFLNVSTVFPCLDWLLVFDFRASLTLPFLDSRRPERRHYLASYWPRSRHPRYPPAMDRVFVRPSVWLLPAPLGPHRRHLRQATHLHPRFHLGHHMLRREPLLTF